MPGDPTEGEETGAGAGSEASPPPDAGGTPPSAGGPSASGGTSPATPRASAPPPAPAAPAAPKPPSTWDTMVTSLGDTVAKSVKPFQDTFGSAPPGTPPGPFNPVKKVSDVASGVMGMINLPLDLINTGFAVATNAISQALPSFPAATMGALYVGLPHSHAHPPSLIPPAPPVPLPSLGPVMLGTCITVLIGGMPTARAGDVGFAPTCCGFYPVFEIVTGSSKVFIGGSRAARMLDLCKACQPSSGPASMIDNALTVIGPALGLLGAASDAVDAVQASDAAMASAMALSASMKAAQAAADAAAAAIKAAMGSDPATSPASGMMSIGVPTVLVGGFPMPNIPNPVIALLKKAEAWHNQRRQKAAACETEPCGCPGS